MMENIKKWIKGLETNNWAKNYGNWASKLTK